MSPDFGAALRAAITSKGLSINQFAKLIDMHSQNLYEIIEGRRRLPLKHLDAVVAALAGAIRPAEFRELCLLDHSPEPIRTEYWRMKQRLR